MTLIKNIAVASTILITVACSSQKEVTTERTKPAEAGERQGAPPSIDDLFKMDVNKDDKLTKLEVTGPILEDFDKLDVNKDGFLTREELGAGPKRKGPPPGGERQGGRPPRR